MKEPNKTQMDYNTYSVYGLEEFGVEITSPSNQRSVINSFTPL